MDKKIKTTFFSDSGHGWLSVKRKLLGELNILNKISHYSYQKGNTVYLEEDADVTLLYDTLKERFGINKLDDFFEIKVSRKNRSPVRSYYKFQYDE